MRVICFDLALNLLDELLSMQSVTCCICEVILVPLDSGLSGSNSLFKRYLNRRLHWYMIFVLSASNVLESGSHS